MRRTTGALAGFALAALLGCHHDKHQLACKFPEEYTLPPDEPRFNNPPESSYRRPPPKKEATKPGANGMGPSGGAGFGPGGAGGFNNNGMPGGGGMGR